MLFCRFLVFLIVLLLAWPVSAITNIESIATSANQEGVEARIDLSVLYRRGNTNYSHYAGGLRLMDFNLQRQRILILDREYADTDGDKSTDRFFTHLRHVWLTGQTLDYEAFIQYQTNDFTFLQHRSLIGGGIKLTVIPDTTFHSLNIGMGGYYTEERYKNDTLGEQGSYWRGNFYATYRILSLGNSALMNTVYIQPRLNKPGDIYALNDFRLESFINRHLSLFVSITHDYKSHPFADNKRVDGHWRLGLSLRF